MRFQSELSEANAQAGLSHLPTVNAGASIQHQYDRVRIVPAHLALADHALDVRRVDLDRELRFRPPRALRESGASVV